MQKIILPLLSLITAALLAGCDSGGSSKISQANFDKLKEGMARTEVVAILGEPTGSEVVGQINDTEIKAPIWESGSIKIVAAFTDDNKLTAKRLDKK